MARRGHLPGLHPLLRRLRRGRSRRPARHPLPAAVSGRPRRGRAVDHPVLRLADGRLRLRRGRLPGRGPGVRHAGRLPGAAGRRARARVARDRRPGAEPHLGSARVVRGSARGARGERRARAIHLPRGTWRARGTTAERLGVGLRRPGVDPHREPGRHAGPVVPAPVRPGAAGPELGAGGGARGVPGRAALLAGPRRRRLPGRRRARHGQGGRAAGRRARRPRAR